MIAYSENSRMIYNSLRKRKNKMKNKITREFLDSLPEKDILFIRDYIWEKFGKGSMKEEPAEDSAKEKKTGSFSEERPPCPECGGTSIIKWGFNKDVQRYKCKECGCFFDENTGTLLHSLKCSEETLLKAIDAEIRGDTISEIAYQTGLKKSTCFNIRHRLHALAGIMVSGTVLSGQVELDSTYAKINLSGTRPQNMPRLSKKRGKHEHVVGDEKELRGPSHHKVCIATAIDRNDNIVYRVTGLGIENLEKYEKIEEGIGKADMIISDGNKSIIRFAKDRNIASDSTESSGARKHFLTPEGNSLGDVNQLHQELKDLSRQKHGISTRHIQGYLDWITYTKKLHYRYEREEQARKVYEDLKSAHGKFRCDEVCSSEMPISLFEAYAEYNYGICKVL